LNEDCLYLNIVGPSLQDTSHEALPYWFGRYWPFHRLLLSLFSFRIRAQLLRLR
jgi:hypothetical protein